MNQIASVIDCQSQVLVYRSAPIDCTSIECVTGEKSGQGNTSNCSTTVSQAGFVPEALYLSQEWARLATNGTNTGLYPIRFHHILYVSGSVCDQLGETRDFSAWSF